MMERPRLIPGGVTHRSAVIRVDGWPGPDVPLELTPPAPDARSRVEPAPVLSDEARRWRLAIDGLAPDTIYTVRLGSASSSSASVTLRTAPDRLSGSSGLLLGVSSCYFPSDEYWTNARAAVECLDARARRPYELGITPAPDPRLGTPTAFFLCGDQIYADVPRSPGHTLEGLYRGRYESAWGPRRLGPLLARGGNFFAADDHELWNGYPDRMFWLARSWDRAWQDTASVAIRAFEAYQAAWNLPPGFSGGAGNAGWAYGRLGPIDLFVGEARARRTGREARRCPDSLDSAGGRCPPGRLPTFMTGDQLDALIGWLSRIERLGVLVLSQPLLQTSGPFDGALSHYRVQFRPLLSEIRATLDRGASLIVITGDIHWGRLISWARPGSGTLVEFVSSPLARVGTLNILHTQFGVGRPLDPTGRPSPEAFDVAARTFGPSGFRRHFATGENNFGLLRLNEAPDGRLLARFELWSLQTRRLAIDRWGAAGRCLAELPV